MKAVNGVFFKAAQSQSFNQGGGFGGFPGQFSGSGKYFFP